jgi:hypothetical protein
LCGTFGLLAYKVSRSMVARLRQKPECGKE